MDFSGIEKLSLLDYDGYLATTLFMAGCPFRCPYCHNGELVVHPELAQTIPWEEVRTYLKKRKGVLEAVVITGGEPTIMPDLFEKIAEIKSMGYKVKLDSNGYNPKVLRKIVDEGLVDFIAMDIKNCKEAYAYTSGVKDLDISRIEESVKILMENKIPYEFRTTILKEFHSEIDIKEIGKWIQGCSSYHLQKYNDRETCIAHGYHEVPLEEAKHFIEVLKPYIPNASLRGY